MKHRDVFWHARLVGAGPDLWGKKLCLAALIAAVGGVHQKFASEHTFTENSQDTSLTTARNHRVESAALQMQSPSECYYIAARSFLCSLPQKWWGWGRERPGLCLVKGGCILAEDQNCACGAVPLRCPACEERWSGTQESTSKLSVHTTVENSPRALKQKMNLAVTARASKSRGVMGPLHIQNKRWREEEDRDSCRLVEAF